MTHPDDTPDDHIASLIDANLKRVYSDIVEEELPDRFKDLLSVLKAQEAADEPQERSE